MKVIIVEDEPLTRMDLRILLERGGEEVVAEGRDGIDAVNLCKAHHPDMVIMDINMPNVDGLSAAKVIRRDNLSRAIVLVTAYSEDVYINKAQEVGVDGYLVKPIDQRMLLPTIKIALTKAQERESIQKDLSQAVQKLEARKVVERAKGHLMKAEGLDEQAAYERIRSLSMEKHCSMGEISEIILLSAENVL